MPRRHKGLPGEAPRPLPQGYLDRASTRQQNGEEEGHRVRADEARMGMPSSSLRHKGLPGEARLSLLQGQPNDASTRQLNGEGEGQANAAHKASASVPSSSLQQQHEGQLKDADEANDRLPSLHNRNGEGEGQSSAAYKATEPLPSSSLQLVEAIRLHHRKRRYAMKVQQKLDRALESFVRENATDWHPSLSEAERKKENDKAHALIKVARDGTNYDDDDETFTFIVSAVVMTDRGRAFADKERSENEKAMEKLAKELPVYPFWEAIPGAGALGLATIVAEAGNLTGYETHSKLWKRLGFAPFEGLAGSSWKRQTWRPRALTKEEWVANPFSGERYALMHQIAVWLRNKQCEAKEKSGTRYGKPKGRYGELYVHRRERTAVTHADWSDGHAHMDALRYMMKRLLRDLWQAWNHQQAITDMPQEAASGLPAGEQNEQKAMQCVPVMASRSLPSAQLIAAE